MANVIVATLAVALLLGAALTLSSAALSSASDVSLSWNSMVDRRDNREKTELEVITADINGATQDEDIDTSIRNTGQTALARFEDWDVVIKYYSASNNTDMKTLRLTYTTSGTPASGEWTVEGIYLDFAEQEAEVFEPDIFNPGEEMLMRANITPAIPSDTDNLLVMGAENGVTLAVPFSR